MACLHRVAVFILLVAGGASTVCTAEPDDSYFHDGPRAGSLKSSAPLPLYDSDRQHVWNRLFAAFYIRESNLPDSLDDKPIRRFEGGDYIDFFGWGGTKYWSSPAVANRLDALLDEFIKRDGARMIDDPLKRTMMLRDLWAPYDFLIGQNIQRFGDRKTRGRRAALCRKLATVIASLARSKGEIANLPDNYAAAVKSGHFDSSNQIDETVDYLPAGLLTRPYEWVEVDFFQPNIHEDLYKRFITLHSRAYRGRSYFRIFYRFPKGRQQLTAYLKNLEKTGIDWRQAAQDGFILLKKDAPQIPVGTEVALVQFLVTLDEQLRPTPTKIVESIRHRLFRNVDGSDKPESNTGVGVTVREYTLKRRLLFDNLRHGGLQREPDQELLYRIIFQPPKAKDWGTEGRKTLFQQCIDCHMTPKHDRTGVHSMPSIVHMGGFDAGAQLGVVHPLHPKEADTQGKRVARWKTQHESYRRLLEYLNR